MDDGGSPGGTERGQTTTADKQFICQAEYIFKHESCLFFRPALDFFPSGGHPSLIETGYYLHNLFVLLLFAFICTTADRPTRDDEDTSEELVDNGIGAIEELRKPMEFPFLIRFLLPRFD